MNFSNMKPQVSFYFDSKQVFDKLSQNPSPEKYECFDQGDEFRCFINVEKAEDLCLFLEFLKGELGLGLSEISDLTSEIWDGYGFDELEPLLGEELANQIIDSSWKHLESLF